MSVTVYGASDDLIEVDGDIVEEFTYDQNQITEGNLLAFSDGTVLRVVYSRSGVWRITTVASGTATVTVTQAPEDDDDNYSDRATVDGDVRWVVQGGAWAGKR